jgi:hypothetical protein
VAAFLAILLVAGLAPAKAAEQDPVACLREIERVCVRLEEKLETCLAERGDQLSGPCRDELKMAMSFMEKQSGPAACVPDVQRLCPSLRSDALGQCIVDKQNQFSEACQKYLHSTDQQRESAAEK